MEKFDETEMADSDESNEDLLVIDMHHCEQIMPQGEVRPNIISNEIQVDGQREFKNIVSLVPVHDVEESSSNMSNENNLFKQNQTSPLDLNSSSAPVSSTSNVDCDTDSSNDEIQKSNVLHDIDTCNISTTNTLQNSIYVRDIDQPSSSNVRNSNLNSINQPSNPFLCKTCYKKYASRSYLKIHLATHIKKKMIFCSACHKRLSEKEYIEHMLDHCKENPFVCGTCNKQLSNKNTLKSHMLTHSDEMTHTGKKPHKCHLCKKKFVKKSNLTKHMLTHRNGTS